MTIYETEKCLSAMQKSHITVKANSIRKIEEEEACENCVSCFNMQIGKIRKKAP